MVDNDNGVISVQHKEAGTDMSGDLGLGVTNIFVIFNIEVGINDCAARSFNLSPILMMMIYRMCSG